MFRERDDWKSLVESVQKDRNRLQDDYNQLQSGFANTLIRYFLSLASFLFSELDKARDDVALLTDELQKQQSLKVVTERLSLSGEFNFDTNEFKCI